MFRNGLNVNAYGMNDTVDLYRGDSTKIKQFDITKTDKHSLLGRGLYLTSDLKLARSYLTKGRVPRDILRTHYLARSCDSRENALLIARYIFTWLVFDSSNPNRLRVLDTNEVDRFTYGIEQALNVSKTWATRRQDRYQVADVVSGLPVPKLITQQHSKHALESVVARAASKFHDLMVDGQIEMDVDGGKFFRGVKDARRFSVRCNPLPEGVAGSRVSVFRFNARILCGNIINVHQITDPTILQFLVDHGYYKGREWLRTKEWYGGPPRCVDAFDWLHTNKPVCDSMRREFASQGVLGFAHTGGLMSGGRQHQVFVLWDDSFVNQHKVGVL